MLPDNATKVYLSCEWKLPSAKVDGFLKIWLGTAHNPMKVIKHLAEKLLSKDDEDDEEGDFDFNKTIYKSCTITNFHTWYSAMMSGLSQFVYKNVNCTNECLNYKPISTLFSFGLSRVFLRTFNSFEGEAIMKTVLRPGKTPW